MNSDKATSKKMTMSMMHGCRSVPRRDLAFALAAWALALLWCVRPALAQSAPAGNEHPPEEAVSAHEGELAPPFGAPELISELRAPGGDPARKAELAARLDLAPLRTLAVFHSGRVKILDTLARDTILRLTGGRTYFDLVPTSAAAITTTGTTGAAAGGATGGGVKGQQEPVATTLSGGAGGMKKVHHDPLFTFLDLIIDPVYYLDKPLIYVNYLPLRREFFEQSFGQDDALIDRWMRLQRVTPFMVDRYGAAIAQSHMSETAYRDALGKLDQSVGLWQNSASNLLMVASASPELPWTHLSTLPAEHPARAAALELGAAWRKGDADGANAAIVKLAEILPTINTASYPTSRRDLEMFYNRANAFEWGMWAYFLAFLTLILGFGTGRTWLVHAGTGLLVVAIALHAVGFILRCVLAERFAIQNQFESMTGVSLFAAVAGLVIMLLKRQHLFGAAAAGVGFLILVTATQTAIPGRSIEREAAILNTSVLLKYHVTTVLVSYGLIALGFLVSLFYLAMHYTARSAPVALGGAAGGSVGGNVGGGGAGGVLLDASVATSALGRDGAAPAGRARILADLDTAQMTVLQLAFWTLGVGILLGAWWADHSWGRWWAFDPKETWALITWIVYLIVIHLRVASAGDRGLMTAWLSVAGFIVMLWTYFGVNLLLPGLHAYA